MGTKVILNNKHLPSKYQKYNLSVTINGISDSVYFLGEKYILKIFENADKTTVNNEQKLLLILDSLKVPKVIDHFHIANKESLIYSRIEGKSIKKPNLSHIKQLGEFLKKLHTLTKNRSLSNRKLFTKKNLKQLILNSQNKQLLKYFNSISIVLKNDGIIHGDLFYDNANFYKGTLSGVYDFSEACNGDFTFELAVVSISWCFDKKKLNEQKLDTLIKSYGLKINRAHFYEYIKYALLYYATTRYINNKNYNELLNKLDALYKR
ncbi:MAG: phosphotransferase [Campylobacterota bacterium]|nr:phosphotransferase [Campylobacterota bacterium]